MIPPPVFLNTPCVVSTIIIAKYNNEYDIRSNPNDYIPDSIINSGILASIPDIPVHYGQYLPIPTLLPGHRQDRM